MSNRKPHSTHTGPAARAADASPSGAGSVRSVRELLQDGLKCDREGRVTAALEHYNGALRLAESSGDTRSMAEALRRLGVLRHRGGERAEALALCEQSLELATAAGDTSLAADALNALGGIALEGGDVDKARSLYERALELGHGSDRVRSSVEQNLGIIANIQGDLPTALEHYRASLHASQRAGDYRAAAASWHNLGMVSADLKRWDEAHRCFEQSHALAVQVQDTHLRALCLLNRTEVYLATQHFSEARESAEQALSIFDELDSTLDKADAYRMLGTVFREIGKPALAEPQLRMAIRLAVSTGTVLSEAEATRELAILFQSTGRNQEALTHLNAAYRLFGRLKASGDLVDVASKVQGLEGSYRAVVQDWGQSIESADAYTHGHCERVASYAKAIASVLGLDEAAKTTIELGAYLHDVGKVRVPHEILNKPGPLDDEEFAIIKKHPEWGVELVADIDFPWDIKPIIRHHHEKYDGTGYPDRLAGDAIPMAAQVICAADVYDALTSTRSYRGAMSREDAMVVMNRSRHWWRPDIFEAFTKSLA